jgi:hypothetical protein
VRHLITARQRHPEREPRLLLRREDTRRSVMRPGDFGCDVKSKPRPCLLARASSLTNGCHRDRGNRLALACDGELEYFVRSCCFHADRTIRRPVKKSVTGRCPFKRQLASLVLEAVSKSFSAAPTPVCSGSGSLSDNDGLIESGIAGRQNANLLETCLTCQPRYLLWSHGPVLARKMMNDPALDCFLGHI